MDSEQGDKGVVRYQIDEEDRLVSVNGPWRTFALENDAETLATEALGVRLASFFRGAAVREVYRQLFERVRQSGSPVEFPYRCDSPVEMRLMHMHIAPAKDRGLEFRTHIMHSEAQRGVPLLHPSIEPQHSDELLRVCAWCRRVHAGDWIEVEEAVARLQLFERPMPDITHGICEPCADGLDIGTAGSG